ncbi:hypothetical protein [Streptomyces sp. NRRL F-5135]|uniref:hypothetical protein n=1 Tax=Streptomyces sp. NRRL F-5135 TaxID=1463858 RepID=UPI000568A468|nr:hypothetical protein [Streptomyces sp. NRRL F-5135]
MADDTATTRGGKQGSAGKKNTAGNRSDGDGLRMHTLHAKLPIPYLTPGDVTANARAAGSKLAPPMPSKASMPSMPPPKRLAFYGGLGALAVFGAVDWPVALAIGAATVVARGGRRQEGNGDGRAAKRSEEGGAASTATSRRRGGGARSGTEAGAGAGGGTKTAAKTTAKTTARGGSRGGTGSAATSGTRSGARKRTAKA